MSATAARIPGVDSDVETDINETVHHEPQDSSESPSGGSASVLHGRYTFGSGARPLDGYTIKRAIGRGGFGEVYFATSDSGREVALKLILRNLDVERRGVAQCMNLKCSNLLTIFDMKTTDEGDAFVVMEYVAGPSLASVLKQYPDGMPLDQVKAWLRGLVEGTAYLHEHGIVHRDLKPANLFMEEGVVKIGDYGLAKLITPSQGSDHSESIGTCHYMAPEIGSGKYHKSIDIYAIGVILYEMLTGRVPFDGETVNEVLMKHLTARPDVSMLAEPYRAIVARALLKDPSHRTADVRGLLPAGEGPGEPQVRVIGAHHDAGEPDEPVHRIDPEEPLYYIGPDTQPPHDRKSWRATLRQERRQRRADLRDALRDRFQANWDALKRPARYQSPPTAAQPPPVQKVQNVVSGAAPRPRPADPEPPPQPTARMRIAELTASMLWSAPLLALLSIPAMVVLGIDPSSDPAQLAYLYLMSLLGTWMVLAPNKLLEPRRLDLTSRRLVGLVGGVGLGVLGIVLYHALELDWKPQQKYLGMTRYYEVIYFGALFGLMSGWMGSSVRARTQRFRARPILWTAVAAYALLLVWPFEQDRGLPIAVAVLIPIVVQLVSPWDEAAVAHARYVTASARRRRTA